MENGRILSKIWRAEETILDGHAYGIVDTIPLYHSAGDKAGGAKTEG